MSDFITAMIIISTIQQRGVKADTETLRWGKKFYITTRHTVNVNLTHLLDDRSTKHTNEGLKLAAEGDPKYKLSVWYQLIDMSYVKKRVDRGGRGYGYTYGKRLYTPSTTPKKTRKDNERYQP